MKIYNSRNLKSLLDPTEQGEKENMTFPEKG